MIVVHRLGHRADPLHLNPDLIATIEAHPDTVVTLTTGARVVVDESPEEVAEAVLRYRSAIVAGAMANG
jgi:flagellar protein FlbD